jgi:hypothetical protein
VRTFLTILALVIDGLCLVLLLAVALFGHPGASALFGLGIFGVVLVANLPALVWTLVAGRLRTEVPTTASIFE